MNVDTPEPRIGLVLSGGGLRGAAHLGVLRQILRHGIPIDVMVGVSAGAVVAAYYAAVGLSCEEMIEDARIFRGRHLVLHSLNLRSRGVLEPVLRRFCGVIPTRLGQLKTCRFDRLHHGVGSLGIACYDLTNRRPRYLSTVHNEGVTLYDAVTSSASLPYLLPPRPVHYRGERCRFADGGIGDSLPVGFARAEGLAATHLIVSDCRRTVPSRPARVSASTKPSSRSLAPESLADSHGASGRIRMGAPIRTGGVESNEQAGAERARQGCGPAV